MRTEPGYTIVVILDTIGGPSGVRSFYRTVMNWSKRNDGPRLVVICSACEMGATERYDPGFFVARPFLPLPNPFYRDLPLGLHRQSSLQEAVRSIAGPKIIHIASQGPLGIAGARAAARLELPLVGCYHAHMPECAGLYGSRLLGRLGGWLGTSAGRLSDRVAFGKCCAMIAPTESAARAVGEFFDGPVQVIPNPVDTDRFRPALGRHGDFRERYGSEGRLLAVVVGRLAVEKNLDLIGRHLCDDVRIRTVFVGDGPFRGVIEKRWGAKVTGFLHGEDLEAAYQQADVLVQLSAHETFGLALAEAMASGLPAIALRSRGLVEALQGPCGVELITEEELPTLADRCVALVRDPSKHREAGQLARAFAERLDADRVVPKFCEFHGAQLP